MKPVWFVYMLKCADGTFYTGVTTNLERRVKEHNESLLGAKYTKARRPVVLVHSEKLTSRSLAQIREATIKKLTREAKLLLLKD